VLWFGWHLPQFFVITTYRDASPVQYPGGACPAARTAICARTGELMARHLRGGRAQDGSQARKAFVTWLSFRAGDGNRTRAISLRICADRERPLVTGVNGPLMARR
jgi:hypothetical protein